MLRIRFRYQSYRNNQSHTSVGIDTQPASPPSSPPPIDVVCAVMLDAALKSVLIAQRSENMTHPLLWEFPGGKIEPTEKPEDAIIREIREELGCTIRVTGRLTPTIHSYSEKLRVRLIPLNCQIITGSPVAHEHLAIRWVPITELMQVDWVSADIPIATEIIKTMR